MLINYRANPLMQPFEVVSCIGSSPALRDQDGKDEYAFAQCRITHGFCHFPSISLEEC